MSRLVRRVSGRVARRFVRSVAPWSGPVRHLRPPGTPARGPALHRIDAQVLYAALPRLAAWLAKVFTVMGGFMASTGDVGDCLISGRGRRAERDTESAPKKTGATRGHRSGTAQRRTTGAACSAADVN